MRGLPRPAEAAPHGAALRPGARAARDARANLPHRPPRAERRLLAGTAAARRDREGGAQGREPWLSVAPAHIIVLTREQDYHDRYNEPDKLAETGGVEIEWPAPFWYVDAGAAMMLLLLAAIDEGLAAGVYGVTVPEMQAFKELLGIPDDVHVVTGVTVGKARPDPNASRASSRFSQLRRAPEEVVRWER